MTEADQSIPLFADKANVVAEEAGAEERPQQQSATAGATAVQAVSIRPLKFWTDEPELWFVQMDSMFAMANITREITKYRHVLANLEVSQMREVRDIVIKQFNASDRPYTLIRERLISRLAPTPNHDLKQMLEREQLGDRRPSQLLRELQRLSRGEVSNTFIRALWISRLPESLQTVLATRKKDEGLEELGSLADTVFDLVPRHQVAKISTSVPEPASTTPPPTVDAIAQQVAAILLRSHQFMPTRGLDPQQRSGSRSRRRSQGRSPGPRAPRDDDSICWYHRKFGIPARLCRKPCSFKGNAPLDH